MAHIPFTSSGTFAKPITKVDQKTILISPPPCNHLTKENISDWFKIVLGNCILSEKNLMHFHIKLILSLRKMKSQSSFMLEVLTIFNSAINASAYSGRARISTFSLVVAQCMENLDLHVLTQNSLQDWKGWNIPKHILYHTGMVWIVCAMSMAKELLILTELPTIKQV